MQICIICILSSSHYVIAQSKAFFVLAFKIYYATTHLRHSFVVHPILRKILDPPQFIGVGVGCGAIIGVRGWVWDVGL